jgi:hypothetical protein
VEKKYWDAAADSLIKASVSENRGVWVLNEARRYTQCVQFVRLFLPLADKGGLLAEKVKEHMEDIFPTLVAMKEWSLVGDVLKMGVSEKAASFAVLRATNLAFRDDLCRSGILRSCMGSCLGLVMRHLMRRRMWDTVVMLMRRASASAEQLSQWVEEMAMESGGSQECFHDLSCKRGSIFYDIDERVTGRREGEWEGGVHDEKRFHNIPTESEKTDEDAPFRDSYDLESVFDRLVTRNK